MTGKKLRLLRLKKLNRQELNRRLDSQKSYRRKESLALSNNPHDSMAKIGEQELTRRIGELKQMKGMLPHPQHKFLVVSSSRHGPMLYAFCRDKTCRHRVFKALTITTAGSPIEDSLWGDQGMCPHSVVSLRRGKHFNISAVCLTCGQSAVVRNVFVKSRDVVLPKISWSSLGMLGDSMLPRGDPRLLP